MPTTKSTQTYYGIISLIIAVISVISLIAYFQVATLNIQPATFSFWNNLTTLVLCLTTPASFTLAILAWRSLTDSKSLASISMALTGIPFLILLVQFVSFFIP